VHLRQGRGREGGGVDRCEERVERGAQILLDLRTQLGELQRGGLPLEFFEFRDPLGSEQVRAGRQNLAQLDKGRAEDFKHPADPLGMFQVCDLIGVLPPHELADSFSHGFKTHVLEQIPEAGDAENPDDFAKPIQIGHYGLDCHDPARILVRRDATRDRWSG